MPNYQSVENLLSQLKASKTPKFTLFLGAGASVSSGVKSGTTLVEEWRVAYDRNAGIDETKNAPNKNGITHQASTVLYLRAFTPHRLHAVIL